MRAEGDHLRWDGGELIRLYDGTVRFGADFFPDPRGALIPDEVLLPVQAYLFRRPGQAPVLIDTGSGSLYGENGGRVPDALSALGVAADDIGAVFLTHLHGDHCGGLIAQRYEQAQIHVSQAEMAYWPSQQHPAADLLAREAGRIVPVAEGDEIAPGLRVLALPGHTPGQVGLVIDGQVAVVGDMLHRADIQLADPLISTKFDIDPVQAAETRVQMLRQIADAGMVFCAGHARLPGLEDGATGGAFLRLQAQGAGFRAVAP